MSRCFTAVILLLGVVPTLLAGENSIVKVYPVADLVVPIDGWSAQQVDSSDRDGAACAKPAIIDTPLYKILIRLITDYVAPGSWTSSGGTGAIEFFPLGMALVVQQTPEVHDELGKFLESLRALQTINIAVSMRLITMPESSLKTLGIDSTACVANTKPMIIDEKQLQSILKAVQGNPSCRVLSSPNVQTLNGCQGTIEIGQRNSYLTRMTIENVDGVTRYMPHQSTHFVGTRFETLGVISNDQKNINLKFKAEIAELMGPVPLTPVTIMVAPISDGAVGESIPFTQNLQNPTIRNIVVEKSASIPFNHSLVMVMTEKDTEKQAGPAPAILSNTPYVNRLFKNKVAPPEKQVKVCLITPRIMDAKEFEPNGTSAPPAPMPVTDPSKSEAPRPYVPVAAATAIYEREIREAVYQNRLKELVDAPDCQRKAKEREFFKEELRELVELALEEIDPSRIAAPKPCVPVYACPGLLPLPEPIPAVLPANAMTGCSRDRVQLDVMIAQVDTAKMPSRDKNTIVNGETVRVGSMLANMTGMTSAVSGSNPNVVFGIVPAQFRERLEILKGKGIVKNIAEPKLIAFNGLRACFQSGGQQAVPSADKPGVNYVNVGVEFEALPIVDDDGKIHLEVSTRVRSVNEALGIMTSKGVVPGFDEEQVKTSVVLEDGQTFAVGGLIQTDIVADGNQELVILVTPHLVDLKNCNQTAKPAIPAVACPELKQCEAIDSCPAQPACRECCAGKMNLADVAALSMSKISDDIILNQIRTTGAAFSLGAEEIIWLKKNGVSDRVVMEMQNSRLQRLIGEISP